MSDVDINRVRNWALAFERPLGSPSIVSIIRSEDGFHPYITSGDVLAILDRLQEAEAVVERVRAVSERSGLEHDTPLWVSVALMYALEGPQDAATGEVAPGSTDEPREPQIVVEDHERCQCCGQPSEFDVCEKCNAEMAKHPLSDDERRLLNGIGFRPSGPDGLLHLTDEEWQAGLHATAIQIAESRAKRGASGAESDHGGRGDGEGLG